MPKKDTKPKDPNAPKKNQTAYFLFGNERRPILAKENEGKSVTELSKIVSAEWKTLDADKKKVYEQLAAEDKERYNQEMGEYKKTDSYSSYQQRLKEWTVRQRERADSEQPGSGKKAKPPKKPKQPKSMPKRPQSSYFIFNNERRTELIKQYPQKKITELSKLIADEWKVKTAEEKKVYEDKAAVAKERYNERMEPYKETQEYKDYVDALDRWKQAKKSGESLEPEKKISLPRKPKDDAMPKRPLTSYFLYAKAVREETKKEFPDKPITEIAKEISKKWKVLTEDDKQPYNEEAAQLKEKYEKDLAEYKGSEAQLAFKVKLEEWKKECDRRRQQARDKEKRQKEREKKQLEMARKKKKSPKKSTKTATKKAKKSNRKMDVDDDSESESDSSSDSDSGSSSSGSSSGSDSDSDDSEDSDSSSDSDSDSDSDSE